MGRLLASETEEGETQRIEGIRTVLGVYKMLDLTVMAHASGSLDLKWALGGDPCGDNEPLPLWSSGFTTLAPRFRAVLTGNGSGGWELVEASVCVDPGH